MKSVDRRPSVDRTGRGSGRRRAVLGWMADLAVVAVFVVVGRRSHEEGAGGFFVTALPLLAALQTGWLLRGRLDPLGVRAGVVVWGSTVVLGLLLRLATGDTAALGFIVVTALTLAVGMLGWRLVVAGVRDLRRRREAGPRASTAAGRD